MSVCARLVPRVARALSRAENAAAAPTMGDDAAAREWLGGSHGGFDLSTRVTDVLLAGFNKDPDPVWTMDDVPVQGDVRTSSALVRATDPNSNRDNTYP